MRYSSSSWIACVGAAALIVLSLVASPFASAECGDDCDIGCEVRKAWDLGSSTKYLFEIPVAFVGCVLSGPNEGRACVQVDQIIYEPTSLSYLCPDPPNNYPTPLDAGSAEPDPETTTFHYFATECRGVHEECP
jgi:hypothetical protein